MAGRLAVDFGTSNTVLALWDPLKQEGVPLHIPDFGQLLQQGDEQISIIPSLIYYGEQNQRWIGAQVREKGLADSPRTLRWMKRYISNRTPLKIRIDERYVTPADAGRDFLNAVLLFAAQEVDLQDEEVALTVPVEAFEHYENWLGGITEATGIRRYRLLDEPSAAALGYGAHIQPGNVYLIFDFGGGTLHASVILIENEQEALSGKRCRVLGKAGRDLGGSTIDQWLFQDVLKKNKKRDSDEDIRPISTRLLGECERVKTSLTFTEQTTLFVKGDDGKPIFNSAYSAAQFETLLDEHDLFTEINQVIRQAINQSREKGFDEDALQAILMVGGSSQIPSVQRALRQSFGKNRVFSNRPLDAVARGAAAFIAGVDFYDHIQHDYAIRYIDPAQNSYQYRVIVPRGTDYPTHQPLARLAVKASYDGQQQMGIAIFEMGQNRAASSQAMELVFDPSGAVRVAPVTAHEQEQRSLFWLNEQSPTFLNTGASTHQGEASFEVEFNIDENKRLLISARDLATGQLTHKDAPVVKLT
jgi:molecular chaperone DnaK (HSP70)